MKKEGRERAEHGFTKPADGWHICEVDEGIAYFEKDGVVQEDKNGKKKHIFPLKINDADDEANGAKMTMFVSENDRGEQTVADLAATGQYKKFAEKFPGEVSVFDAPCMSAIKTKLPGQFLKVRTTTTTVGDKSYTNIAETATMQFDPTKDEKAAGKGKAAKEKATATTETKAAAKGGDDW